MQKNQDGVSAKAQKPKQKPKKPSSSQMDILSALCRGMKSNRLNRDYCGRLTVRELAAIVVADNVSFPKGLDTPLCVGDFEGNFCTDVLSVTTGGIESDHACLCGDPHAPMI